jgi:hypothetical protein
MTEEDEAFNEIERMSKVRQEILRSLNRKRQIQAVEYKDMIAEAVAAEREACAKLCEQSAQNYYPVIPEANGACTHLAAAIRARGQA